MPMSRLIMLFLTAFLAGSVLTSFSALAQQEESPGQGVPQPAEETEEDLPPGPAELVTLELQLEERLGSLENEIAEMRDYSQIGDSLSEIESKLDEIELQLKSLEEAQVYDYYKYEFFQNRIDNELGLIKVALLPLEKDLSRFESLQKDWLEERELWSVWKSYYSEQQSFKSVEPTFEKAQVIIDKALVLISDTLDKVLNIRREAGELESRINSMKSELDTSLPSMRSTIFRKISPVMLSPSYFSQFNREQFQAFLDGASSDFNRELEIVKGASVNRLIGFLIITVLSIAILLRYRSQLETIERWRFIVDKPLSAGLFIGLCFLLIGFRDLALSQQIVTIMAIGLVSLGLFPELRKNPRLSYIIGGLILIQAVILSLTLIDIPNSLHRLLILLASLLGFLALKSVKIEVDVPKFPVLRIWRKITLAFFVVVIFTEFLGYSVLAEYIFNNSIRSLILILVVRVLRRILNGLLELGIRRSALQSFKIVQENSNLIASQAYRISNFIIFIYFVCELLAIWRFFDNAYAALEAILSLGFSWGSAHITVGLLLVVLVVLYGSYFLSWFIGEVMNNTVFEKSNLEKGVRASYRTLIKYFFVFVGFLIALGVLGFDLRNIAIVGGALGVGIGFGLQNIVMNFVSGIVLLFERPVKVGDVVTIEEDWGVIRNIGLRSTIVGKYDHGDLVIPNSVLTSNTITNWTLGDKSIRAIIPVGVAYDSDIPLVMKTLSDIAESNDNVMNNPEPQILFQNFGESSLDFELRVWVGDVGLRLQLITELHHEILKRFRQLGIEIAYPQRDIHLKRPAHMTSPKLSSPKPGDPETEPPFRAPSGGEGVEE